APPSTTIPSGALSDASRGGNRSSRGAISILPSGSSPKARNRISDAATSLRPAHTNLVRINASPMSPTARMSLDGTAKKPSTLEMTKNIAVSSTVIAGLDPAIYQEKDICEADGYAGQARVGRSIDRNAPIPDFARKARYSRRWRHSE